MSQKYNDYLKTDYWKAVSDAVKKRDGYRCRICNSQHDLSAHHRTYDHRGREMDFLDDLTTLCRRCHGIFHGTLPMPPLPEPTQPAYHKKLDLRRAGIDFEEVERDMPPDNGPIFLTKELIDRCRNKAYAFTNAAVRPLGAKTPLIHGWCKELRGKIVTREAYREALEGRYVYNSGPLPKKTSL
jgi:hypothetical protein